MNDETVLSCLKPMYARVASSVRVPLKLCTQSHKCIGVWDVSAGAPALGIGCIQCLDPCTAVMLEQSELTYVEASECIVVGTA